MLPTIRSVTPRPDYQLCLVYDDGETVLADFKPVIEQGGVFAQLADPAFFALAAPDERGRAVCWPGDIDFCADALRQQARAGSENGASSDRSLELLNHIIIVPDIGQEEQPVS